MEDRLFITSYVVVRDNNVSHGVISLTAKDKGNALLKMEELLLKKFPNIRTNVNLKSMMSIPANTEVREE